MNLKKIIFPILFLFAVSFAQAQNKALVDGEIYKIRIIEKGMYRLDRNTLTKLGINLSSIDPRNIQIFGNAGGMLPQANNATVPNGLQENAIWIRGEEDGKFDNEDLIVFYADAADRTYFDQNIQMLRHEKNLYSDANFYFLKIGNTKGKRVSEKANLESSASPIVFYDELIAHEKDENNILSSNGNKGGAGREWFGEIFDFKTQYEFEYGLTNAVPNSPVKVFTNLMAYAVYQYDDNNREIKTAFSVGLNGRKLGEQIVEGVYKGDYESKGRIIENTWSANLENSASQNLKLQIEYNRNSRTNATGYLNYFDIHYLRNLVFSGNSFQFRSLNSTRNGVSRYQIQNTSTLSNASSIQIWHITKPTEASRQVFQNVQNNLVFGANSAVLEEFAVFNPDNLAVPAEIQKIPNQDLTNLQNIDFLIIAHTKFLSEAQRLAKYRQEKSGFRTKVLTVDQIYNDFNSGRQDVSAIRNLIRKTYETDRSLKYVLLFGDASYRFIGDPETTNNYIPTYQARESLHPIYAFCSDDFFGLLEENEGEWSENEAVRDNSTVDVGIGRLPATTLVDAQNVVNKIILYESAQSLGAWRKWISMLADDGDYNRHQLDSDLLSTQIGKKNLPFNLKKLYLDAFPQAAVATGEQSLALNQELLKTFDQGTLILNYTGHGSPLNWAQESIINFAVLAKLENLKTLPLLVTATCDFGRFDFDNVSGAETTLFNARGGAIALLTTSRPVYSNSNFLLNTAFYNTAFAKNDKGFLTLGDITRITKNNSIDWVKNRNFTLLGDPSMRLAYPKEDIVIKEMKANNQITQQFKALDRISVSGEIQEKNLLDANFNGILDIVVFDKPTKRTTLGNEDGGLTMNYEEQSRILFKGTASVRQGKFSFNFIVPKNIDYSEGEGKISLYASDPQRNTDASGFRENISVTGSNNLAAVDTQVPKIQLFMDTLTFRNGMVVRPNTKMIAFVEDESGINVTGGSVGQNLLVSLSNGENFVVNEYYVAQTDSYQKGKIVFPFKDLPNGNYTLKLTVWDTYNNAATETINFTVEQEPFAISELIAYPNPFIESTNFRFSHNRIGANLDINLEIYDLQGRLIASHYTEVYNADATVEALKWDTQVEKGEGLRQGLYIYRIKVTAEKTKQSSLGQDQSLPKENEITFGQGKLVKVR